MKKYADKWLQFLSAKVSSIYLYFVSDKMYTKQSIISQARWI